MSGERRLEGQMVFLRGLRGWKPRPRSSIALRAVTSYGLSVIGKCSEAWTQNPRSFTIQHSQFKIQAQRPFAVK